MTKLEDQGRDGLARIVAEQPFFADLSPDFLQLVTGCAKNVRFDAGELLLKEGTPAEEFYLLRNGLVALEVTAAGRPNLSVLTLHPGDMVGLSWIVPPYRATFDAKAISDGRAISIDGACLRRKCDADHSLGYEMMQRFVPLLIERLQATRLQVLDLYGPKR